MVASKAPGATQTPKMTDFQSLEHFEIVALHGARCHNFGRVSPAPGAAQTQKTLRFPWLFRPAPSSATPVGRHMTWSRARP